MTLERVGDLGIIVAGVGIVTFAVMFLTGVRWWTDVLGRSIAAVVTVPALIMGLSAYRFSGGYLPGGVQVWRATLFPVLGVVVWVSFGVFIWFQFFAPRRRANKEKEKVDA